MEPQMNADARGTDMPPVIYIAFDFSVRRIERMQVQEIKGDRFKLKDQWFDLYNPNNHVAFVKFQDLVEWLVKLHSQRVSNLRSSLERSERDLAIAVSLRAHETPHHIIG